MAFLSYRTPLRGFRSRCRSVVCSRHPGIRAVAQPLTRNQGWVGCGIVSRIRCFASVIHHAFKVRFRFADDRVVGWPTIWRWLQFRIHSCSEPLPWIFVGIVTRRTNGRQFGRVRSVPLLSVPDVVVGVQVRGRFTNFLPPAQSGKGGGTSYEIRSRMMSRPMERFRLSLS